jgi:hypothetical protein
MMSFVFTQLCRRLFKLTNFPDRANSHLNASCFSYFWRFTAKAIIHSACLSIVVLSLDRILIATSFAGARTFQDPAVWKDPNVSTEVNETSSFSEPGRKRPADATAPLQDTVTMYVPDEQMINNWLVFFLISLLLDILFISNLKVLFWSVLAKFKHDRSLRQHEEKDQMVEMTDLSRNPVDEMFSDDPHELEAEVQECDEVVLERNPVTQSYSGHPIGLNEEGEEAVLNRLSLPAHVSESAKRRWKLAVADAQATADIQSLVREIDQQQFFNVVENAVVLNKTQMQNKMLAE